MTKDHPLLLLRCLQAQLHTRGDPRNASTVHAERRRFRSRRLETQFTASSGKQLTRTTVLEQAIRTYSPGNYQILFYFRRVRRDINRQATSNILGGVVGGIVTQ